MKHRGIAFLFALAAVACAGRALAVAVNQPVWNAEYVAAYQPTFGSQGVPYAGDLTISVNHGILTGTYTSFSNRPDPYYGRILNVTGGVNGENIHFQFGSLTLQNGKLGRNGAISGTAHWNGRLYSFLAKPRQ